MTADPLARLLGDIDRPVTPRPEFAEALLDHLLIELGQRPAVGPGSDERGNDDPMIDASTSFSPSGMPGTLPGTRLPGWPGSWLSRERVLTYLATAALVIFVLVTSYVAFGPHQPGGQEAPTAFLAAPDEISATLATDSAPVEFLWQATGEPNFRMQFPTSAAIDPQGNLWVTDGSHDRIVILAPGGRVLSSDGVVLEAWGTSGSGEGEFEFTCSGLALASVAFDQAGNIYVADSGNHRIQKFAPDRTFLTSWGGAGAADDQLQCPLSLVIDKQGRIYVGDHTGGKIAVFDADGQLLATWKDEVSRPEQLALDGDGNLWVADTSRGVQKFSPDGELLAEWDTYEAGGGRFNPPMGLAIDAQGRVFVSGQGRRVQVFSPSGEFLVSWGVSGGDPGEFTEPAYLVLDGTGHIYAVDLFGHRVQKFRLLPPLGPG
jgi:sugar lactone lactonase YvrE